MKTYAELFKGQLWRRGWRCAPPTRKTFEDGRSDSSAIRLLPEHKNQKTFLARRDMRSPSHIEHERRDADKQFQSLYLPDGSSMKKLKPDTALLMSADVGVIFLGPHLVIATCLAGSQ